MPLVSMRQLLDHAAEHRYGIPAFNVNNLEQVQAVMMAASEVGAPVILQASAGARKYAGEAFIKHLILAAIEQYPQVPLVMHQDHGQSPGVCQGAIDLGFSSVMMDAFNITQDRISRSRLAGDPPDLMISPKLNGVGLFEFYRADESIQAGYDAAERALGDIAETVAALSG